MDNKIVGHQQHIQSIGQIELRFVDEWDAHPTLQSQERILSYHSISYKRRTSCLLPTQRYQQKTLSSDAPSHSKNDQKTWLSFTTTYTKLDAKQPFDSKKTTTPRSKTIIFSVEIWCF